LAGIVQLAGRDPSFVYV